MNLVICPGFARSGTTTLYNLLVQHPECCKPESKELHFFLQDYDNGKDFYLKRLRFEGSGVAVDVSPGYAGDSSIPEKIYDMFKDEAKFIFMLREPRQRLLSFYNMEKRLLHENLSLEEAMDRNEEERINRSRQIYGHDHGFGYRNVYDYCGVMRKYYEYFPKKNIHIVVFEEFVADLQGNMVDICRFLDISDRFVFDTDVNTNPGKSPSRFTGLDKAANIIKMMPFLKRKNWKESKLRKLLAAVKSRLVGYEVSTGYEESGLPADLKCDLNELSELTGREYGVWEKDHA